MSLLLSILVRSINFGFIQMLSEAGLLVAANLQLRKKFLSELPNAFLKASQARRRQD